MFMNQTLVANVSNKNVYLINNQSVPFYICIPNGGKASIVLNLVNDVRGISMNNNMTNLTNEVTNIYSKFNFSDVAVVTPILDSNLLEQAKLNINDQVLGYLDKVMGYLINTAYTILNNNNIMVDNKIKFNNNISYRNFNEWFVKKYNGRVELVDYYNAPVNKFDNVSQLSVTNNEESAIADNVLNNTSTISTVSVSNSNNVSDNKEPGFVSYVLLGVIVAVISLVILYMLL